MTATPPQGEAVRILEEGDRAVMELVGRLTEQDLMRTSSIGGGDWSAKDLLCHLAFWGRNALEALEDWRAGGEWRRAQELAQPGGDDAMNAKAFEESRALSADAARATAVATHMELITAIAEMSLDEWTSPAGRGTYGSRMGGILGADGPFRHAFAHIEDLRAFVESV